MIDTAKLRLWGYLCCVYAAGVAAVGWVVTIARWDVSAYVLSLVVVVAMLMIASEFTPIRVWSRGRFQEYTFSGAFALVLLQVAPLEWAVLPQAVAVLVEEVRQRRPAKVAAFNVAQNILMFVLARIAMDAVEGTAHSASASRQPAALALGAAGLFRRQQRADRHGPGAQRRHTRARLDRWPACAGRCRSRRSCSAWPRCSPPASNSASGPRRCACS